MNQDRTRNLTPRPETLDCATPTPRSTEFGKSPNPARRPPLARGVRRPAPPLDVPGDQPERFRHGLAPPGDPRLERRRRAGQHDRLQHQRRNPRDHPAQAAACGGYPGHDRRHHSARLPGRPGRRAGRLPAGHHRPEHHRRQDHGPGPLGREVRRGRGRPQRLRREHDPGQLHRHRRHRGRRRPATATGVSIASPNNTVGGTTPDARERDLGQHDGRLDHRRRTATGNVVEGNYIGTNAAGTGAVGNTSLGVYVGAPGTTVGGTASGAGNVISGNGAGVQVEAERRHGPGQLHRHRQDRHGRPGQRRRRRPRRRRPSPTPSSAAPPRGPGT